MDQFFSCAVNTLFPFVVSNLISCHFGEIYRIELHRTKKLPSHPPCWSMIDGLEIMCVDCSRFLCCSVFAFVLFGSMNRSSNTFGRDVWSFFWSILINFNKIKHDPLLTHVLRGTKRACSSVAAKITLLPNNCNWAQCSFCLQFYIKLNTLHLMDFLEVAEYLLANAAFFVPDMSTCSNCGRSETSKS